MRHYILDDKGNPVFEPDLFKWSDWFASNKIIHVASEIVFGVRVSTVFLGLDYNYTGKGEPILWETMIFGGKLNQQQKRCSGNRERALEMHAEMVEHVLGTQSE